MAGGKKVVQALEGVEAECWTDMGFNHGFRNVFFVCPRSGRLQVRPAEVLPRLRRDWPRLL